jgi:hypothetical protein
MIASIFNADRKSGQMPFATERQENEIRFKKILRRERSSQTPMGEVKPPDPIGPLPMVAPWDGEPIACVSCDLGSWGIAGRARAAGALPFLEIEIAGARTIGF